MLVCHPVGSAEEPVVIECGSAAKFRLSAGRASLFHVHGELVIVCTDRVRFFRLV